MNTETKISDITGPVREVVVIKEVDLQPRRNDWWTIIDRAEMRSRLTFGLIGFTAKESAQGLSWFSCACGSMHPLIPTNPKGSPKDAKLAALGKSFFDDGVLENNFQACRKILEKIEAREAELLKELAKC